MRRGLPLPRWEPVRRWWREAGVNDLRLVARMTLAGTLAWWLCTLLGQDRPLFAALVPLVAMLGDPYAALNVSLSRVLGVLIGVLLGIALIALPLGSTGTVALLLATALTVGLAIRIGGNPNNQIAITALFMLYIGQADRAEAVGIARIWETAIGALVAIAVSAVLWPPDPVGETRRRARLVGGWTRADLAAAADVLAGEARAGAAQRLLDAVRERSREAVRFVLDLDRGAAALRWNLARHADRAAFDRERRRLLVAARACRHTRTVVRLVADRVAAGEPPAAALAEAVRATAGAVEAAVADDPHALLAHAEQTLYTAPSRSPGEFGLAAKLRQIAADLRAPEQAGSEDADYGEARAPA